MPNPVRKVTKLGVDNQRRICKDIMFSTCVVMVNPEDAPTTAVTVIDGETLNDTLNRMWAEVTGMRKRVKLLEAEVRNLKVLNNKINE